LGAPVQQETAEKVAQNVFLQHNHLHNRAEFNIADIEIIKHEGDNLIYIFHLLPTGFILVPADDQAVPGLAFGFDHDFKSTDMPVSLQSLMNQFKVEMIAHLENSFEPQPEIQSQWDGYLSGNFESTRDREVTPLLSAEFDQSGSWNNGVTSAIGFTGPVGCVAVAMCQIMHYWGYPESGQGSNYYFEDDYGYLEVNFEDANYDFNSMAATYATSSSQLLLYHAGVAVNMDYDHSGSGAWVVGNYPSAFYAMENFFRYSSDMAYEWKDNHSTTDFRNLLKNEIDNNRPVIYQGYDNGGYGGHAWNIDGYSGNNLHCNWGWGGYNNGYFNLTTMGGFPNDQAVIFNLMPQMEAPVALFEYEISDLTVTFTDLSAMINEVNISNWSWDFGDGTSSNSVSPVHTYVNGGQYEVSLIVSNNFGMQSEPHLEIIQLGSTAMPGDVNEDEVLNILDIVIVVNFVLGNDNPDANEFSLADLNGDGTLNILDIVSLTNLILDV